MHKCNYLIIVGWVMLFPLVSCQLLVPEQSLKEKELDQLTIHAPYIFEGTIQKVGGDTKQNLLVSYPTAVVTVNKELKAPKTLGNYTDRKITVVIKKAVKDGERFIFFSKGLSFGRSLVVTELGRIPFDNMFLRDLTTQMIVDIPARLFRQHIDTAELVVVGKVDTILSPPSDKNTQFVSEHFPHWRVAKITIVNIEKGIYNSKTLLVPFPSSRDIMWWDRPKFTQGQEGIWILHSNRPISDNTGMFEITHRSDFLPLQSLVFVRQQITKNAYTNSRKEVIQ